MIICSCIGVLKWNGGFELYECALQVCGSAALREIELWFRGASRFVVEVEL